MVQSKFRRVPFVAEYSAIVRAAVGDRSYPLADGFLHGVMPGYDRSAEYEAAINSVPVDMGRRAMEIASTESFFSLYASAFYLDFKVVDGRATDNSGDPAARLRWLEALQLFPNRIDVLSSLAAAPDAGPGGTDVLFAFRILENIKDDMAVAAEIRRIVAHDGHLALTLAYSHNGPFEFDDDAGFRVYDEKRVLDLLEGFKITTWNPLESAAQVANSPRPFDLTTLHVSAKRA